MDICTNKITEEHNSHSFKIKKRKRKKRLSVKIYKVFKIRIRIPVLVHNTLKYASNFINVVYILVYMRKSL